MAATMTKGQFADDGEGVHPRAAAHGSSVTNTAP